MGCKAAAGAGEIGGTRTVVQANSGVAEGGHDLVSVVT
jgi:hypothetical protein